MPLDTVANRTKRRKLPSVDVPQTVDNDELRRSLESLKEHVRMYEGDSGAPKERFVTIEELELAGLIGTKIQNNFALIDKVLGAPVAQGQQAGGGTIIFEGSGGVNTLSELLDTSVTGARTQDFLQYTGGVWTDFNLFDNENVWTAINEFQSCLRISDTDGSNWHDFCITTETFEANTATNILEITSSNTAGDETLGGIHIKANHPVRIFQEDMSLTTACLELGSEGINEQFRAISFIENIGAVSEGSGVGFYIDYEGIPNSPDNELHFGCDKQNATGTVFWIGERGEFNIEDNLNNGTGNLITATQHPFQLGPTAGINLRMGRAQIQAVNNGTETELKLNPYGGDVSFCESDYTADYHNFQFYLGKSGGISGRFYLYGNSGNLNSFMYYGSASGNDLIWSCGFTTENLKIEGWDNVLFEEQHVRITNWSGADYADFFHNDTDFLTTFAQTGDWYISGLTGDVRISTDLKVDGTYIQYNSDAVDPPTEDVTLEVYRGGVAGTTAIRWNETTDRWEFTNDGTTYQNFVTSGEFLTAVVDDTAPQLGGQLDVNGNAIGDGTLELLAFTETGSAVNHLNITNAATGNGPTLSAVGDDTDIDLNLAAKGTGNIAIGPFVFDADQTVGAGQDNYILTYDNATGLISLEIATGGSGTDLTWTASTRTIASSTGTDAVISLFTSADAGLTPASGGGTTNYLRADGTWAAPAGGSASNSFETHTVTDTDSGFTWAETGSAVADSTTDTLTWVSGTGIDIDVDATSDAIRIANTGIVTGADLVLDDISDVTETTITSGDLLRWNGSAWVNYADSNYATSGHTHLLAAGATDVTATAAEVNLLDLSGLTAGWALIADSATTASWQAITESDISDLQSYLLNVVQDTTPQLGGNLDVQANVINTSTVNGDVSIQPNGTGNVLLGNYEFDADQTLGAGLDNYVLTYDNGTGEISLEVIPTQAGTTNLTWTASTRTVASDTGTDAVISLFTSSDAGLAPGSGGGTTNFLRADGTWAAPPSGGINNVVEDTTPELGGPLDVGTEHLFTSAVADTIRIFDDLAGTTEYHRFYTDGSGYFMFGGTHRIYAPASILDYTSMSHDGAIFTMAHTSTTDFDITGLTADVRIRDGAGLKVQNSTDTGYVRQQLNVADYEITSNIAVDWIWKGFTDIRIEDGATFEIWDAGDTDHVDFSHDGTDFNTNFVNTTQWYLTGTNKILLFQNNAELVLQSSTQNLADSAQVTFMEGTSGQLFGSTGYGFRWTLDGSTNDMILKSGNLTTVTDRISVGRDSGDISLGNFRFNTAQSVGAGQDNYVLTYDNGTGDITLEVLPTQAGTTNLTWTASTRTVASDTGTDAVISLFTSTDAGLAPSSGGGTTNYLRADGTWAAPPGGSASNSFETQTVTDTDSGFTWAATGSAVADSSTDTLTWVSGTGINIDVDATSDAIRITNTGVITETNDLTAAVTWANVPNANITEGSVTQHAVAVGGAMVLENISDVTETTITTGDVLRWNGSAWVNYADSNYAASSHTHLLAAGATDVTATAAELNLLDLAGLTAGWALIADSATTASWQAITESDISDLQSYLLNVVQDTTPQLGGMLDVNGQALGDGTLELLTFTETASAVNHINLTNATTTNGPTVGAAGDDANIDLVLAAKGTGNITLGNFSFDADQTVGAGQDNYVLTYDNGTGLISLEPGGAGSQTPWASDIDGAGFGLDNIDRLEIQDGTGADTVTFEHNGTLFSTTCVGTGDWKVYGLTGAFEINQQANATSTLRIGESATLRGAAQNGRLDMYGEVSSTLYLTRIENTGTFFNFGIATGQAVNWTGDGDWTFDLHDGADLVLWDSTDTDSASFQHDGTNFNTVFTGTTVWDVSGATVLDITGGMDVRFRDGLNFQIYDSADTSYIDMSHSGGSSPNRVFTINCQATDYVDFTNIANPGGVRIRDGAQLEIYDPTDASYLVVNHDGTDVNWTGVNTTDFIVDGLTWFKMLAGGGMAIYDSTNADEGNFSHDGTDFNINFVGTTNLNVNALYGGATSNDHQLHAAIHKWKDAALSRNTTTTLADDDDLFGIVLDADCVYSIEFYLVINSTSATPDFKMAFQLSQTAQDGQWAARVGGAGSASDVYAATLTTATAIQVGASAEAVVIGRGMIHTHATLSTTMDLQWAQNTSDATNVTLELGSWLRVTKMGVA